MRRGVAVAFGACDLVTAAVVSFGVFGALPARYAPVDAGAAVVVLSLVASAAAAFLRRPWSAGVLRVASLVVLSAGLVLLFLLALTVSYLAGIYGAVGRGGATIVVLVALLVIPYLVALPAAQLVWVGPARAPSGP